MSSTTPAKAIIIARLNLVPALQIPHIEHRSNVQSCPGPTGPPTGLATALRCLTTHATPCARTLGRKRSTLSAMSQASALTACMSEFPAHHSYIQSTCEQTAASWPSSRRGQASLACRMLSQSGCVVCDHCQNVTVCGVTAA